MFSREKIIEAMRAVVAEKGSDYVYPESEKDGGTCQYAHKGTPSCIVGHLIHRLDPEAFAHLAVVEADHGSEPALGLVYIYPNGETAEGSYSYLKERLWPEDLDIAIQEAQSAQDFGKTWGDALGEFEDNL